VSIVPGDVDGTSPGSDVSVLLGAGAPAVSMSPAQTEPERTHVKAIAIKKRFMFCAPVFES
jgi:hypothetical protein